MRRIAIGGMPSLCDNKETMLSPLTVGDVHQLWFAATNKSWATLVDLIQSLTDRDVSTMYVQDLVYLSVWLRKISSTEISRYATWTCNALAPYKGDKLQNSQADMDRFKSMTPVQLSARGIAYKPCGNSSTASLQNYRQKTRILQHKLDKPLTYPKVYRYLEDDYDHEFADMLFWIDAPDHASAAAILDSCDVEIFDRIREAQERNFGVYESYYSECQWCRDRIDIERPLELFSTLKIIDPKSMMNMRYNLGSTNIHVDENTPLVNLIYWHNQYKKDKDEAEEKRRLAQGK